MNNYNQHFAPTQTFRKNNPSFRIVANLTPLLTIISQAIASNIQHQNFDMTTSWFTTDVPNILPTKLFRRSRTMVVHSNPYTHTIEDYGRRFSRFIHHWPEYIIRKVGRAVLGFGRFHVGQINHERCAVSRHNLFIYHFERGYSVFSAVANTFAEGGE